MWAQCSATLSVQHSTMQLATVGSVVRRLGAARRGTVQGCLAWVGLAWLGLAHFRLAHSGEQCVNHKLQECMYIGKHLVLGAAAREERKLWQRAVEVDRNLRTRLRSDRSTHRTDRLGCMRQYAEGCDSLNGDAKPAELVNTLSPNAAHVHVQCSAAYSRLARATLPCGAPTLSLRAVLCCAVCRD